MLIIISSYEVLLILAHIFYIATSKLALNWTQTETSIADNNLINPLQLL